MSSIYSEPQNNAMELYLNLYGSTWSFGELSQRITAHFGEDAKLDEFVISVERHQVRGCSCCYDSSDYEQYLVITKRSYPQEDTLHVTVSTLAKD